MIFVCLNYYGFLNVICILVNEVVCYGILNMDKKLKNGDIVNIDVMVIKDGYFGDNFKMYVVGEFFICDKCLLEVI